MAFNDRPLLQAIKGDHNQLREYYQQYLNAKGDPTEGAKWANAFIWGLARHSVGEEIAWYPQFGKVLGEEGSKAVDHDRADHQKIKEHIYTLQSMKATDPEYFMLLVKVFDELSRHMQEEEQVDLPNFESKITEEESARLAKSFRRTKNFVPTRAHPSAPNRPPFETAVALMMAPIDKLRDMFTTFPDEA